MVRTSCKVFVSIHDQTANCVKFGLVRLVYINNLFVISLRRNMFYVFVNE